MKTTYALTALSLTQWAITILAAPTAKSGVIPLTIRRDEPFVEEGNTENLPRNYIGRRNHVSGGIDNNIRNGNYIAHIGVGSPWQTQEVIVDTGSSDTWMFSPSGCSSFGCNTGSFDPSKSSTFHNLSKSFHDGYIGASADGYYFKDQFSFGGIGLSQLQMGLATKAQNLGNGILGLNGNQGQVYRILPQVMKDQGWTQTSAFSIYLNDVRSSEGNLLFGGYDSAKFTGPLVTMPWNLAVTGLSLNDNGKATTLNSAAFPMQAFIDTGAGNVGIPPDIWTPIASRFKVKCNGQVACSINQQPGSLDFTLGGSNGVTIKMPFSQLTIPIYNNDGSVYTVNGVPTCQFSLQQGSMGGNFLGDPFLRNAYTVWDSDRQQVAMAQAVWNSTSSQVVEIVPFGNLAGAATVTNIPFASPAAVKSGLCGN